VEKTDPRGRNYFWIAGTPQWQEEKGTDHAAISSGQVSITPLHLDLTDYRGLEAHPVLQERLNGLVEGLGE
jgi:5'-nucleotidase